MATKVELSVGEDIFVNPAELKPKGFVGEIMWDIAFCTPSACRDQKAYMELLEYTAKEIIEKVKEVCKDPARHEALKGE